jgi:5-(carboxyamino)imidazole ribonucleotide synthase
MKRLAADTILKTRRLGYDGKGQARLEGAAVDGHALWQEIGATAAVLEARIPFLAEVSAVVARSADGQSVAYDVPVNAHRSGILHTSSVGQFAPLDIDDTVARAAQKAAITLADALDHVGVLTVEFFLTEEGALLVNEFAPRVHNSGHWTMDACLHDQFDNHIRAVAGWPLGAPRRHSDAQMTNLIGEEALAIAGYLENPDVRLHLYGKAEARKGRKMGHVTQIAPLL